MNQIMMRTPTVSVIMSVYKEPLPWITQSVDSILNQTYSDFELIIVDDASSDGTKELLESFK